MKSYIMFFIILLFSTTAIASDTNSSCEWLAAKWKCVTKNSWNGNEETEYYNIARLSNIRFRINYHPTQMPDPNSYLDFDIYLDGRLNLDIGGRSSCEDSKLVIDYLEDLSDESSLHQQHVFKKISSGMQLIKSYYKIGDVTFSNCIAI